MARWEPDARQRLERAAIELFTEQGFAATTVPEITARAGLTTRTFFRHFADKREVLFAEDRATEAAYRLMGEAPPDADPLTLIVAGLRALAAERFEPRRDDLRARRAIIRSDEGLRERELRKRGALHDVVRAAFIDRGLAPATAALLAEIGATLLYVSLEEWLDRDDARPLADLILDTLGELRAVLTVSPAPADR
ncbi:TetR/AcrR family transcriptional regulator [Catenuloplanes atrovinosus]|uniref:AcrR family transcriptional regulator n=1 Tax=Catenuloplanes atrovinosus TaxID=137266 RepID=A0AAE4C9S4_9ACTN|nr:helix-turn-helix domain-containing protein [Catenuloplanes atrovinosus]MDR7276132.1 AcrR family transcriptional regulator [Catenuloplanes atrovinosus]